MNIYRGGTIWLFAVALCTFALLANVNGAIRAEKDDKCDTVTKSGNGWQWFCCGDCQMYPSKRLNRRSNEGNVSLALMGGGTDTDDSFLWMLKKQDSPVVTVLRSHGDDAYNPYIYNLAKTRSVSTFVVSSRAGAESDFVNAWVRQSTIIWFAGGAQDEYWNFWDNSTLQDSVNYLIENGSEDQDSNPFTVGGTSAGLAILGQYIFAAENGSVVSSHMLRDPYYSKVDIVPDMLYINILRGIITDTHFEQRDRMGRLVGFVSRIMKDHGYPSFRGYAANEKSAFDSDENGIGQLATYQHNNLSACYFIQAVASPDDVIQPGTPLSLGNPVTVYKLTEGNKFDIPNWRFVPGAEGVKYVLTVKNGVLQAIGNDGSIY